MPHLTEFTSSISGRVIDPREYLPHFNVYSIRKCYYYRTFVYCDELSLKGVAILIQNIQIAMSATLPFFRRFWRRRFCNSVATLDIQTHHVYVRYLYWNMCIDVTQRKIGNVNSVRSGLALIVVSVNKKSIVVFICRVHKCITSGQCSNAFKSCYVVL